MKLPVLKRMPIASISRRIRGIPSEVVLDSGDGMPTRCAVSRDNRPILKALVGSGPQRMSGDRGTNPGKNLRWKLIADSRPVR